MKLRKILAIVSVVVLLIGSISVYAAVENTKKNTNTAEDASSGSALSYVATGQKFAEDTIKVTWINVWYATSESWVNPDHAAGIRYYVDGEWIGYDWDNEEFMWTMLRQIAEADIDVVVFDLTNGYQAWHVNRAYKIAEACRELGLQFCCAAGNTDAAGMNSRAKSTWDMWAGPDAELSDIYFHKDGKPVFVNYVIKSQWESMNANAESAEMSDWNKFTNMWASGQDPAADKWGWQLTPNVGTVPSEDSMFVSGSSFWGDSNAAWFKSLAWLDYNMLVASESQPDILIVGSYDDVNERNGWNYQDTSMAEKEESLYQKDIYGNLTIDGWHDRVVSWFSEEGPTVVSGGTLMDGAYIMSNANSGLLLGTDLATYQDGAEMRQYSPLGDVTDYVWLYHVGNDNYRICRLSSGKSLAVAEDGQEAGDDLIQEYDTYTDRQFWKLTVNEDGTYTFTNNANGLVIGVNKDSKSEGAAIRMQEASDSASQKWEMEPVRLMK